MFEIDNSTGVVSRSCNLGRSLDREQLDQYQIKVTATDLANNTVSSNYGGKEPNELST